MKPMLLTTSNKSSALADSTAVNKGWSDICVCAGRPVRTVTPRMYEEDMTVEM